MSDRDALLAAIRAHPEEDTPRLALADLLEESGESERAARIRIADPWPALRYVRTKAGRAWWQYAAALVAPALPKSWAVWPIQYPPDPSREHSEHAGGGEDPSAWEYSAGTCMFSGSRPYFVVGLRYGFVSAVAAPVRRLVKALPAVVRLQPVCRVAVTDQFFEYESFVRPDTFGPDDAPRNRVIRRRANDIPPDVFHRLSPARVPCRFNDEMCAYPTLTAAHADLGRAFLEWAREQKPCPTS